ncbi:MAG: hypothetical protein Q9204_000455 [Flavoplaca sp. TL-2023a]
MTHHSTSYSTDHFVHFEKWERPQPSSLPPVAQSSSEYFVTNHLDVRREKASMPSNDASVFAGACFLGKSDGWSKFRYVNDGAGGARIRDLEDLKPTSFTDLPEAAHIDVSSLAAEMASATCKLYLRWLKVKDGTENEITEKDDDVDRETVSGFWIVHEGNIYILTCAHILPDLPWAIESMQQQWSALKTPSYPCLASVTSPSDRALYNEDVRVRLAIYDRLSDIAIFAMYKEDQHATLTQLPIHCLNLANLDTLPSVDVGLGLPCFIAAYNSKNTLIDPQFKEDMKNKNPTNHDSVMQSDPLTRYAYCIANYQSTLNRSQAGIDLIQKASMRHLTPVFEDTFKPNCKALAVGKVLSKESELVRSCHDWPFTQGELTQQQPIHISAFYGSSGAMVAVFKATPSGRRPIEPKVVGIG